MTTIPETHRDLLNAQVAVLRQTFVSGRTHFEQVGAERTNDLGEYRVAGLPSGSYYVCVSPPPDFKSLIEAAGAVGEDAGEEIVLGAERGLREIEGEVVVTELRGVGVELAG